MGGGSVASGAPIVDTKSKEYRREAKFLVLNILRALLVFIYLSFISSVRSSFSHPDLLLTLQQQHPTLSDHTCPQHWTSTF